MPTCSSAFSLDEWPGALGQAWHLSAYTDLLISLFSGRATWSYRSGVTSFSLCRPAPSAFSPGDPLEPLVRRVIFQPMPTCSISLFSRRATGAIGQAWHLSAYADLLHQPFLLASHWSYRSGVPSFSLCRPAPSAFSISTLLHFFWPVIASRTRIEDRNRFESPSLARCCHFVLSSTVYQFQSRTYVADNALMQTGSTFCP
jgi:hypothetical protein